MVVKGAHNDSKKLRLDQEPKSDNPTKSILRLKPWNSIGNKTAQDLSGGAPFSSCVCVYIQEKMSCLFISLSIPCREKLSCVKIYFPCPSGAIWQSMILQS